MALYLTVKESRLELICQLILIYMYEGEKKRLSPVMKKTSKYDKTGKDAIRS